jgi:hypothetical protein
MDLPKACHIEISQVNTHAIYSSHHFAVLLAIFVFKYHMQFYIHHKRTTVYFLSAAQYLIILTNGCIGTAHAKLPRAFSSTIEYGALSHGILLVDQSSFPIICYLDFVDLAAAINHNRLSQAWCSNYKKLDMDDMRSGRKSAG